MTISQWFKRLLWRLHVLDVLDGMGLHITNLRRWFWPERSRPERPDTEPVRRVRVQSIPGTATVVDVDEESRIARLRFDGGRTWLDGWYPFGRLEPIKDDNQGDER